MKVSNESRSFELRPRFFVSLNPDSHILSLQKSLQPHIRSFKFFDFVRISNPSDIIFPNFQTYVAPGKSEVHNDDPLTEAEVKALADAEQAFQKAQKERLEAERKEAKRQRALARINKL